MTAQLKIINPGLLSTVQDLGRVGHLHEAVPRSGAMDILAARVASIAVGNDENDALIEFTYGEALLSAETNMLIAYSGDGANYFVGDAPIPANRPIYIRAGDRIRLKTKPTGVRSYLAVAGGWNVQSVLGSRSTYITARIGGVDGRALKAGDLLESGPWRSAIQQRMYESLNGETGNAPGWGINPDTIASNKQEAIAVVRGNEFGWFIEEDTNALWDSVYEIGIKSDRMGYQLKGPSIMLKSPVELLSTAVAPGTIQVTGNGTLIILMADCQTTGGYPRIGQVAKTSMSQLAQLKPGEKIRFRPITWNEAISQYLHEEAQFRKLRRAVDLKYE